LEPKERILKAISGKIPDRVPSVPKIWVDLAARIMDIPLIEVIQNPYTALQVIVDAAFLIKADGARQFHFPERTMISENEKVIEVNQNGIPLGEVDMLGGLMTRLYDSRFFNLTNPYHMAFQHFWTSPEPLINNKEDVKAIAVPDCNFYRQCGCWDRQRMILEKAGNSIYLIGDCDSATLAFYVDLCGYQKALMDLIDNPYLVHATMEKGVAIAIEKGKFNIDLGFRVLRLNDSVANMSVISPSLWQEFVFPHMKDVCFELHHYCPEVKIYCHICGNILPVVEDLVNTGLDCIGPLDPLGHFSPAQVREIVGERVSLLGGVNTLSFIRHSTTEIIEEARQCIEQAGQRGGYILSSGCVIPRQTKIENLLALNKAVIDYGCYQGGKLRS
jgi:uroporphyrinogen-III decarboxylase